VSTSVTELPESRVRVEAQVPPEEIERRLQQKARELGRDMKLPGFRKGKVPAPMVIQRIGREAVLDETIREALGRWYADAIDAAGIAPVGDPEVDLGGAPLQGQALTFSIEIGVRPTARLGAYRDLEVPRGEARVSEEEVGREVEALRERLARLETVVRPAEKADFVVIDYVGSIDGVPFDGGEGRDQLVELGSGRVLPGLEDGLLGAQADEQRTVSLTFPEDYNASELAGSAATFAVTVKEVKHKRLPELDDDFAADVGFDNLEELRDDVRTHLRERDEQRVQQEFEEAALDVVVSEAEIEVPEALRTARARELWERTLHSLSQQGITRESYLQITGHSEEEILGEAAPEAEQALRREAVIAAVVAAEGIAPSDEEVLEALGPVAEREGSEPAKLMDDLRRSHRLEDVRVDLAGRRAMELIAAEAKAVDAGQAEPVEAAEAKAVDAGQAEPVGADRDAARELWTPEKEESEADKDPAAGRLWTPGQ